MTFDRRNILSVGIAAGLVAGATAAGPRRAEARVGGSEEPLDLVPGSSVDQAPVLQAAIDAAAARGAALQLPAGRFRIGPIQLPTGTRLVGAAGATHLQFAGEGSFVSAEHAQDILIEDIAFDGGFRALGEHAEGLLAFRHVQGLRLSRLAVTQSAGSGITLTDCGGSIADCRVSSVIDAAIRATDSTGLAVIHNEIADCGNNGIQVWRTLAGEDGTIVSGNRIVRVRADAGGSGQNGNGINVFRAGSVLVSGNRIADCAYTAVRGNAAADIQIIANSCSRLGEVAIYAEFGFEGALIAGNVVDTAASGISVTNFNDGGRLAVVQGNLVRHLFRREHEPVDKRGHGISVEADTALTGNVIEGAPSAGIVIGWGPYMREVVATGNLVRASRVGILVSADKGVGACLIANNMISGAADGAVRSMDGEGNPVGAELAQSTGRQPLSLAGNVSV